MNLEIKHISLKSLLLSAYPLVVLIFSFLNTILGAAVDFDIAIGFFSKLMQMALWTISETLAIMLLSVIAVFAYNFFCSLGIKGVRFTIEEVAEDAVSHEEQEVSQEINQE